LAEFLGPVTNLYLQHNIIEKIENLEFLSKLKVLLLSNNKISMVENLKPLNNLQYLDLSFNQIESFDNNKLPKSLIIFDIRGSLFVCRSTQIENSLILQTISGNKCVDSNEKWEKQSEDLVKYLPKLTQLNGEELYDLVKSDADDDDDDEMTADKIDFIKDESKDTFIKMHDLTVKIVQRSKQRQKQFEISSTKQFEQMKNELEMSNSNLLEKLKSMRNSINYESKDFDS
jgi:Leucine-rich repeat (LRR) protein